MGIIIAVIIVCLFIFLPFAVYIRRKRDEKISNIRKEDYNILKEGDLITIKHLNKTVRAVYISGDAYSITVIIQGRKCKVSRFSFIKKVIG